MALRKPVFLPLGLIYKEADLHCLNVYFTQRALERALPGWDAVQNRFVIKKNWIGRNVPFLADTMGVDFVGTLNVSVWDLEKGTSSLDEGFFSTQRLADVLAIARSMQARRDDPS
jgi:hypothetical protein